MNILTIGDPLLPAEKIKKAVLDVLGTNIKVDCVDWKPANNEEFWYLRSIVEKEGPSAGKPPKEIFDYVKNADMIITQHTPINKEIIDAADRCKVIGVCRAGLENIAVDTATEKGIAVSRTMGRNAHAVSDYTVGLMLAEMRNIARAHAELRKGNWKKEYTNIDFVGNMYGKTIGLVGFGYIGHLVAKKLSGFDVNILVYDPYANEKDIKSSGGKSVTLDYLCRNADFISMHARLTKETENLLGEEQFSVMKSTTYIINTARARLINEKALINALQAKKIGGAGIDVYSIEPPPSDHLFITLPNVTITPHLAGSTKDTFNQTPYLLLNEIKRAAHEGNPRWFINSDKVNIDFNAFK